MSTYTPEEKEITAARREGAASAIAWVAAVAALAGIMMTAPKNTGYWPADLALRICGAALMVAALALPIAALAPRSTRAADAVEADSA